MTEKERKKDERERKELAIQLPVYSLVPQNFKAVLGCPPPPRWALSLPQQTSRGAESEGTTSAHTRQPSAPIAEGPMGRGRVPVSTRQGFASPPGSGSHHPLNAGSGGRGGLWSLFQVSRGRDPGCPGGFGRGGGQEGVRAGPVGDGGVGAGRQNFLVFVCFFFSSVFCFFGGLWGEGVSGRPTMTAQARPE